MLLHHAEAEPLGRPLVGNPHIRAAHADAAFVGRLETVEDAHEGGLAGAVLAHEGMDLAVLHVEDRAVVGEDPARGVVLDHPLHRNGRHTLRF